MNIDFLDKICLRLKEVQAFNKKTVFSISTTAKIEPSSYLTPTRVFDEFVLTGCVIFDQKNLPSLLKKIDGQFDIILVDSEKKISLSMDNHSKNKKHLYNTAEHLESRTLSKTCFDHIKYSKIFEFKPNDLTVNATWCFLSQRFKFLSGKKVTILGAGNIGSKLALKLVECGAEVHLHRRDFYKGQNIVKGLNLIKPKGAVANIHFHRNLIESTFLSDILIGASNGNQIISVDVIHNVNKNCLVVDLGKNNLSKEAIKIALENSLEIYRTDVTASIEAYIYEALKMHDIILNSYGKKYLGFCEIVSGGYFGQHGDIVVDSINKPTKILGVAQGDGLFKQVLGAIDKNKIKKLKNSMNTQ